MIGDFVMQNGCTHPSRVAGVTPGKIHTIWADGTKHAKDACYFEPILLTTEILEKNGFIKVNTQRYDYGHPDTDCYVKVNPKKNMVHVNGKNANSNLYFFSFVHELQHALLLCGLKRLTDNFKV